jgi:hypothetical protein
LQRVLATESSAQHNNNTDVSTMILSTGMTFKNQGHQHTETTKTYFATVRDIFRIDNRTNFPGYSLFLFSKMAHKQRTTERQAKSSF